MTEHPEHLMVVRVIVAGDVETNWNRWYDETHLPEILACPGFVSAARYVSADAAEKEYLTVYKLASAEAAHTAEFKARRGWAQFSPNVNASVVRFERLVGQDRP